MKHLRTEKQVQNASNAEILENLDYHLKHTKTASQRLCSEKFMKRMLNRFNPELKSKILNAMFSNCNKMDAVLKDSVNIKTQRLRSDFANFSNKISVNSGIQ